MLGYVWAGLIIVSVLSALLLGNTETLSAALIESGSASIELLLTMAGILCLWSGILKIADAAVVGTTFKYDGKFENQTDVRRVKEFMDVVKAFRISVV